MAVITDLPVEILMRIFQFYLEQENQLKLICVLSKVCKLWKAICESNVLWIKFDGTVTYRTMKRLCSKGCLDSTKELTVSYTELLEDDDAEKLFSRLKNVEIIDLSQVESFSKNVITSLSLSNLKLKEIQIRISKPSGKKVILNYSELKKFFSLKGANLTTIKLSGCAIKNSSQVLKCMSESCANLEHFEMTNLLNCGTFPTKHFQQNCPKLKVLHLDYNTSIGMGKHSSGFPNLEVFSYTDESSMSHINDKDIERLLFNSPNLKFLSLTNCSLSPEILCSSISLSNLKLKEIQIRISNPSGKEVILNCSDLKKFFSLKGANLTTIKLSGCTVRNSSQVLKCISESCANLEHFEMTNISNCGIFPITHFQQNCPKLKVLHLDYNTSIGMGKHSSGFPNLEVFSYTDESLMSHINDKDIERLLFNSPNLKFLSLTNCSLSPEILCSLPANSVEYLFLSNSKIVYSNNLPAVFKKWCYSLKQVDISSSKNLSTNAAMLILTSLSIEPPIQFLDLSYTQVTPDIVKRILEKCGQLEMLRLNGCRNLERGLKRNYSGKKELRVLSEKLYRFAYDDSTDEEMSM